MSRNIPTVDAVENDRAKNATVSNKVLSSQAGQHYPALDGLRGIAVLLVLLFHGYVGISWNAETPQLFHVLQVGWIGVDIFFVLSGFLITGILLNSRGSPNFFKHFYARRFLRLTPAYFLLLAILFLVLPHFVSFDSPGMKTIKDNQLWFWTYMTNWGFVWHRKVFSAADWLDLTHLWSLAVEEQYYMVWPLVVYWLNARWIKLACFACIFGSLGLRMTLWALDQKNGAIFFPTICRLDGLAMGSLLAIWLREYPVTAQLRTVAKGVLLSAVGGIIVLVVLRGGFVFTDRAVTSIGIAFASLATAAVIYLLVSSARRGVVDGLLWSSALRLTGKISYGLYLYNAVLREPLWLAFPPESIATALGITQALSNCIWIVVFMSISWMVAWISWYGFELHFLKLKSFFQPAAGNECARVLP